MKTNIDIEKGMQRPDEIRASKKTQDMDGAIRKFIKLLEVPNGQFNAEEAFDELFKYIAEYDRVLYSPISNTIYATFSQKGNADPSGMMQSNLEKLLRSIEDPDFITQKKRTQPPSTKKKIDDTQKAVLKIWDHVTLASQQYEMLRESDEEYRERFEKNIAEYKESMTKEMNAQMITMVGIFTALAFLIFGSISSLDGVFENIEFPIFKTMSIGLVWGIGVSNMIFVFLYCVGKMSKLNFKSKESSDANIIQQYPIVFYTNWILISLLALTLWGYFVQESNMEFPILNFIDQYPHISFLIGSALILSVIFLGFFLLFKRYSKDK